MDNTDKIYINEFIKNNVNNFNDKYFNKINNLALFYKKQLKYMENNNIYKLIILIKKKKISQKELYNIFVNKNNIENINFMTGKLKDEIIKEIKYEYIFNYEIPFLTENNKNKIFFYLGDDMKEDDIFKIIKKLIERLIFIIKYSIVFNNEKNNNVHLPLIKIYYTSLKKELHKDANEPFIPFEINSAFTNTYTDKHIFIWRKEELLKCFIHELMHMYKFEFAYYTFPFRYKTLIYNTYRIDSNQSIKPNEAYCETLGNILNIIIIMVNNTPEIELYKEMFSKLYSKELYFSLNQLSKIFNFLQYKSANDFYTTSTVGLPLKQETDVLSYHYFKTKLLFNLSNFFNIIDPKNINKNNDLLFLKYKLENKIINLNFFNNFSKLLLNINKNLEKAITLQIQYINENNKENIKIDNNLKMTILDDMDFK